MYDSAMTYINMRVSFEDPGKFAWDTSTRTRNPSWRDFFGMRGCMKLHRVVFAFIAAALIGFGSGARAQNYSFSCITSGAATNCSTGQSQLGLTLSGGSSSVDFRFANAGPLASSIADIYFDWTNASYALSTSGVITDSGAGVSFSWGASPPNLPGGNGIGFSADIAADSNSPVQPNGVNPGEWVNFNFSRPYADIANGLNTGQLRVGLHVQGFSDGGSASFVTTPIPEPEIYAMMLAGLGLMGFVASRRKSRSGTA